MCRREFVNFFERDIPSTVLGDGSPKQCGELRCADGQIAHTVEFTGYSGIDASNRSNAVTIPSGALLGANSAGLLNFGGEPN
jgi:hypothetical protein